MLQICSQVFAYAVATGAATRNPAADLRGAVPPPPKGHHASITDPREVGGAPLLGIKGCGVIGHGKSDEMAICEGIRMAGEFSKSGINSKITAEVARLARVEETAARATS